MQLTFPKCKNKKMMKPQILTKVNYQVLLKQEFQKLIIKILLTIIILVVLVSYKRILKAKNYQIKEAIKAIKVGNYIRNYNDNFIIKIKYFKFQVMYF